MDNSSYLDPVALCMQFERTKENLNAENTAYENLSKDLEENFRMDLEREACISGGMIITEEKAAYECSGSQLDVLYYGAIRAIDAGCELFYTASYANRVIH